MSAEPLAEHGTDGKDAALSEDIRLLGRLLGDVVRGQAGDEVFELVESVRRRAVDARRDGRSPLDALAETLLGAARSTTSCTSSAPSAGCRCSPTPPRTCTTSGAGGTTARTASRPQVGSLAATLDRLVAAGVDADARPRRRRRPAASVPVITAHPTEVRRQTVLDVIGEVADLLDGATGSPPAIAGPAELDDHLDVLRAHAVADGDAAPVEAARDATRSTRRCATTTPACSRSCPALDARPRTRLVGRRGGRIERRRQPAVVRMGSWIGGDRDGNPFVTADVAALRRRPAGALVALDHHLAALRPAARSSCRCRPASSRRRADARSRSPGASGDDSPFRADEPYRRALRGMYARLLRLRRERARRGVRRARPRPRPRVPGPPYASIDELRRRPRRRRRRRCVATAPAPLAAAVVEPVRRAVVDVRRAPVRARPAPELARARAVVAELLAAAGVCADYVDARRGRRGSTLLDAELRSARGRCASRAPTYSDRTTGELDGARRGRRRRRAASAPSAIPHYVISRRRVGRATCSRSPCCCREVGLVRAGGRRRRATSTSCRCSRRSTTSHRGHEILAALLDDPLVPPHSSPAAAVARR